MEKKIEKKGKLKWELGLVEAWGLHPVTIYNIIKIKGFIL